MEVIAVLFCLYDIALFSEYDQALREPNMTPYGLVLTDGRCAHIYIEQHDSLIPLASSPGCGRYYTMSPDGAYIGCKMICENGLQAPAYIDLNSRELTQLHALTVCAGQVSFAANGSIAYTIGDTCYIRHGRHVTGYDLGVYANYVRISPDGKHVIYNDGDDQLWLLTMATNTREQITSGPGKAYCMPEWSHNGYFLLYHRLDGCLFVYDVQKQVTYEIGIGYAPKWSPDDKYIIYYLPEIVLHEAVGSDLYLVKYDGTNKVRLTSTPERFEVDPCYCSNNRIIFCVVNRNTVMSAAIVDNRIADVQEVLHLDVQFDDHGYSGHGPAARDSIDVPYLHQVYDVPDWFNGHWACAPSTAMMAILYYAKLPEWSCLCSSPYVHTSVYGRYICEHYRYREIDYAWQAQDPSGNWATGGYGYMWSGTNRPYTHMALYCDNHDITSWRDDTPTFSETIAEVNAGYPYGMCVGLTASGHLVLAVGQVQDWHTLICNDPYGNKNTAGYPSYDGKYARYDWPGYNNGYENLSNVYWCVGMHGEWEPVSDTIVDDLQFSSGFYLHTEAPSSMEYWHDALIGYNDHMWWTYTTAATALDTCYAVWMPNLTMNGEYEILAYIPADHAQATEARYQIYTANDSLVTRILDQSVYSDEWVSLGVYSFVDSTAYVYLGDATGTQGQHIGFDAIRWQHTGSGLAEQQTQKRTLDVIQCNSHVTSQLRMVVRCPVAGRVMIRLYTAAGQCVKERIMDMVPGDEYHCTIDVTDCAAGVYIAAVTHENNMWTDKIVIIKQ